MYDAFSVRLITCKLCTKKNKKLHVTSTKEKANYIKYISISIVYICESFQLIYKYSVFESWEKMLWDISF